MNLTCCICHHTDRGLPADAETVIAGYAVCAPHAPVVAVADPVLAAARLEAVTPRQRVAARPWIPDTAHALLAAIDHREETR